MAILGPGSRIGHGADSGDVRIDRIKAGAGGHAVAVGECTIGCRRDRRCGPVERIGLPAEVVRRHERKATGVGILLVVVVGDVEGVRLPFDELSIV